MHRIEEKKIARKNKKIIFKTKSNLRDRILDFKWKIPKQQNNKILIFIIKFPKIKLIGKKPKTIFVNKTELKLNFFSLRIIIILMIP